MSFATDLNYVMKNDASLNEWCSGGIYYENLPENFDIGKSWIVYSFNKVSQNSCLNSTPSFMTYALAVKVISNDTLIVEKINDRLVAYLDSNSYGNIYNFEFNGDNHSMDLEKNIYMNSLLFNVFYA